MKKISFLLQTNQKRFQGPWILMKQVLNTTTLKSKSFDVLIVLIVSFKLKIKCLSKELLTSFHQIHSSTTNLIFLSKLILQVNFSKECLMRIKLVEMRPKNTFLWLRNFSSEDFWLKISLKSESLPSLWKTIRCFEELLLVKKLWNLLMKTC